MEAAAPRVRRKVSWQHVVRAAPVVCADSAPSHAVQHQSESKFASNQHRVLLKSSSAARYLPSSHTSPQQLSWIQCAVWGSLRRYADTDVSSFPKRFFTQSDCERQYGSHKQRYAGQPESYGMSLLYSTWSEQVLMRYEPLCAGRETDNDVQLFEGSA